uniref:Uncharacterized protein n=1 Tax=Lepeophtheirus salmonis TaxID=72036 RepID=A0A0K2TD13_LEPSM
MAPLIRTIPMSNLLFEFYRVFKNFHLL